MAQHTQGPWEYVPGTEHHGPYVVAPWGGDVCDCYTMSNPLAASVRNGGTSFPINHQGEAAEANARLIAAAPELLEALRTIEAIWNRTDLPNGGDAKLMYLTAHAALARCSSQVEQP